jgi:cell volume regulation protein A
MEVLEVESGLNDPMSVFLTFTLMRVFVTAGGAGLGWEEAAKDFAVEMLGGAAMGLAAGWAMKWALTRLPIEPALANVMALTGALALFGAAQLAGASGFLATYLAGVMVCGLPPARAVDMEGFFDGVGWLAQIGLFLMLGLLVTPHTLGPALPAAALGAGVLIFLARPAAVFACLLPFRFGVREAAFAAWVGLRGGVPIYLAVIPALADPGRHVHLFNMVFMVVVASLIVQGWTVGVVAGGLGFGRT